MCDPLTHFCNTAGDVTVGGACSVQNNPSVRLLQCLLPGSCFWRLSARNFGYIFLLFAPFLALFCMLSSENASVFSMFTPKHLFIPREIAFINSVGLSFVFGTDSVKMD